MRKYSLAITFTFINCIFVNGQGLNHQWLLGDQNSIAVPKSRIFFDNTTYTFQQDFRKMTFLGTEANICDTQGNFLMSSNGVWIANATGDTMMNGSGLNPSPETLSWPDGLLLPYANLILPNPGDSTKYTLFHHVSTYNGFSYPVYEIMRSEIDMSLDSGLGAVTLKNDTIFRDTLNWGIGACKHANGRDWWIVVQQENSDSIFKFLFTPNGIESITGQKLNVPVAWYTVNHLEFSPNGEKFAYNVYDSITGSETVLLFDFDRCTGLFSNPTTIPITYRTALWGQSFSPNSHYLYTCSSNYIFQIDVNTLHIDTVAIYDGFSSPFPPFYTSFMCMYSAANGKIYITTGNGTQHVHEMNYPDSLGLGCDVQQHAINLNSYYFRAVPNHPNYYLGPLIGSPCDTLPHVGLQTHEEQVQNFKLSPNPSNGNIKIIYLLPQNQSGIFEVYDLNGKLVFTQQLSPWSSLQYYNLSFLQSGLYQCVIRSASSIATQKLMVVKN